MIEMYDHTVDQNSVNKIGSPSIGVSVCLSLSISDKETGIEGTVDC